MSDLETILSKWNDAKKKLETLEHRISKYKLRITKEMNSKDTDKISTSNYTVTRRRNTRTYVTRENLPEDIWKKYSTRCSFDALFLSKNK
jgi:hypothetical protein